MLTTLDKECGGEVERRIAPSEACGMSLAVARFKALMVLESNRAATCGTLWWTWCQRPVTLVQVPSQVDPVPLVAGGVPMRKIAPRILQAAVLLLSAALLTILSRSHTTSSAVRWM